MKAVILAAGKGNRMKPISTDLPKELIPILDRPFMEYIIEYLKDAGIKDMLIVISQNKEKLREHFGSGKKIGVKIKYIVQKEQFGPAHAISITEGLLKNEDYFLVQYGDSLTEINLPRETIARFNKERDFDAFIAMHSVDDPSRYGIIEFDDKGNIIGIVEKPPHGTEPSNMAAFGTFILNSKKFFSAVKNVSFETGKEIYPPHYIIDSGGKVGGWVFSGSRVDLGYPDDVYNASKLIINSYGRNIIAKSAKIGKNVKLIPPVYIGQNCMIGDNCMIGKYVFVGKNSMIDSNCTIDESVIFENSYIGNNCKLKNALITSDYRVEDSRIIYNSLLRVGE